MKHEQIKNVNILQLDKKTNQILLTLSGATHLVYIERKFKVSAYREITNREDSEFPSYAQFKVHKMKNILLLIVLLSLSVSCIPKEKPSGPATPSGPSGY